MKKSMQFLITLASFSLILSGCGEEETKEKGATKIESNTSQDDTKDKKVSNSEKKEAVTTEDRDEDAQQSTKEDQLTLVNGVSHYNIPDILSGEFGSSIKENTFNIDGFGLLKSTNKNPYTDLKPDSSKSGEGFTVYDNFRFDLNSGEGVSNNKFPIHAITLEVAEQGVTIDELVEKWNVTSDRLAFGGGHSRIYNLDNGTYITILADIDSMIVKQLTITEGIFSEGAPPEDIENAESPDDPNIEMRDGTAYYNFPDITNFDFAYQVCTAAFKINGIKLGDYAPDLEPLGDYGEDEAFKQFGNFGFEMWGETVMGIKLEVADQNVHVDDLIKGWKSKVDKTEANSITYDNDKTNGFMVRVEFDDNKIVQDILILGLEH
ncbi:hypothetical protein MHJ97_05200 [Macrococcus epidermidis]|uniref:hypothetical protein n=1 Tax=Macrococcus epidermidis TaxID=1902580 RepID=UPI001EF2AE50|nr:hypothetical protein [Macrococcus epidermidis]MCG7419829.1 hypothetical protein [Macrococcus epidermidis]